jgi:hypothetical protein
MESKEEILKRLYAYQDEVEASLRPLGELLVKIKRVTWRPSRT